MSYGLSGDFELQVAARQGDRGAQEELNRRDDRAQRLYERSIGGAAPPSSSTGIGSTLLLGILVMPVILVILSLMALGSWVSAWSVGLRDLLERSPLEGFLAASAEGAGGEPWPVFGWIFGAALAVGVGLTIVRVVLRRSWVAAGTSRRRIVLGTTALTAARALVVMFGFVLGGVSGGIARGTDLDPTFSPSDPPGWTFGVIAVSVVGVSVPSVIWTMRRADRHAASIPAAAIACDAPADATAWPATTAPPLPPSP